MLQSVMIRTAATIRPPAAQLLAFRMAKAFAHDPEFSKLLAHRDGDVDLVRMMLEFAGDAYPEIDTRAALAEIDALSEQARQRIGASGNAITAKLEALSELLYEWQASAAIRTRITIRATAT